MGASKGSDDELPIDEDGLAGLFTEGNGKPGLSITRVTGQNSETSN